MELAELVFELGLWGAEVAWEEDSHDTFGFREVSLTVQNKTDLNFVRAPSDDKFVVWEYVDTKTSTSHASAPADKIAPGGMTNCTGTRSGGDSPEEKLMPIEGTVNYNVGSADDSNGAICSIFFFNPWVLNGNKVRVSISKHWYDLNYRAFYHISRDTNNFHIRILIRKIHFPKQKRSMHAVGVTMIQSPTAVVAMRDNKMIPMCFYQGGNQALWCRTLDDPSNGTDLQEWRGEDFQVSGTRFGWSPSAAAYRDKVYVFYHGVNDGAIWYNALRGNKTWDGDKRIDNASLLNSPAACVYRDKLYVLHKGTGKDESLFYSVYDGTSWSKDTQIPNNNPLDSPALVVFKDKLYCFYHGQVPIGGIYWTEFDGTSWKDSQLVRNAQTNTSPSVIVANDKLYMFHQAANSRLLWADIYDGSNWEGDADFVDVQVSGTPAVCVHEDTIYVFHEGGSHGGELWCMPLLTSTKS